MDHVSLDGVGLLRRRMAGVFAIALAIVMLLPGASSAQEREEGGDGRLLRAGNGPGPAANGPGPGCNIVHRWPRSEPRSTFHSFRRPTRSRIQIWQGLSSS